MPLKNNKIKQIIQISAAIIGGAFLLGGVFYSGFQGGVQYNSQSNGQKNNLPENIGINGKADIIQNVLNIIKEDYVNSKDLKDENLLYGAAEGIVRSLDDPYSIFLKPEDAKKFDEDVSGSFGGIGAEIGIRNNKLAIIAPLKDSPAERIGLKSADYIIKIDDTFTSDLTIDKAVKLIRGVKGTKVILNILRGDWEKPKDFTITRDTVLIPTLDWKMKENNIAYVQLYNFNENSSKAFYNAASQFLRQGTRGVILDIRNNPGGFLEVAVDLAGWFLDKGQIVVSEKFNSGADEILRTNGNSALRDMPIVVLINNGSASAAEIMAGALRDQRGIKLIGEKTFGKGTVQKLKNFKDGSSVKITVAKWVMPKGGIIEKKGLNPDIEVKITEADFEAKQDPQLEKALEIIIKETSITPLFKLSTR